MFRKYDHVFLQMAGAIILQLKSTFDCNYLLALTVQLNCLYGVVLKKTFFSFQCRDGLIRLTVWQEASSKSSDVQTPG